VTEWSKAIQIQHWEDQYVLRGMKDRHNYLTKYARSPEEAEAILRKTFRQHLDWLRSEGDPRFEED
jgi:hypothetical protein